MRATGGHHLDDQDRVPVLGARAFLHVAFGTTAVAAAYFLAARLSLALIEPSNGVAVFWPAAGVASGLIIALGPAARLPIALGVTLATMAANLLGDRNLPASIVFALCNAGEALLIAWLVNAYVSSNFALDTLRNVLGLLAATAVGTAVSGIGGTAGFVLFHNSKAPAPAIWFDWFASDALGVITVAPLIIGLMTTVRNIPETRELLDGVVALVLIVLVSILGFCSPTDRWFTILPVTLLLPMAFWVAARCPPVFAACAASVVAFAVVWTITFGIGRLGDTTTPLADRVLAAQTALLALSSALLALAALFQERRRAEAALREGKDLLQESNDRLQLALSAAKLGAFSIDLSTGRLECDRPAARMHGYRDDLPTTISDGRRHIDRDDLSHVDKAFAEAQLRNGVWCTEYKVVYPVGHPLAGTVRWVSLDGAIVSDEKGKSRRMLGVARDITEHKLADEALRNQERAFRRLLEALPAAIHTTDTSGRITFCNRAAIDLWGVSPEIGKDKCSDLGRLFCPDGTLMPVDVCPTKLCLMERRALPGREALFERPDGKRVPIIPYPAPLTDEQGELVGVVSMKIDITERKQAEAALAERNLQLSLAGKAALVGTFAINLDAARKDLAAQRMQVSSGFAAIYGLPAETAEISMSDWRSRVYPRDLPQMLERRHQAFAERRREDHLKYRIVRSCGAIRWIELRTFIEYDQTGHPKRVVGVNIDVTEGKRAEEQQRSLNAELDHRVKNVLATVSAIITQTPKANGSLADFVAGLDDRIKSLARTHELLSDNRWHGVSLEEIVRRELAPYTTGNAEFGGPRVTLQAYSAQAVAMVLHELVTNAAKYGAFSNQDGRVLLRWRWLENGSHDRLAIEWQELGGPPVLPPTQSGYGTSIVRELIPFELGGTVNLDFAPDGLRCRLEISDDWVRRTAPASESSEVWMQNPRLALEVSASTFRA